MLIDTHTHFWYYTPEEFAWITDDLSPIRCDFLPPDLHPLLTPNNITGTLAVQARQSLDETRWLLHLVDNHPQILGVIGWLPLTAAAGESHDPTVKQLSSHPKLRGLRHVLQAEPLAFFSRPDFNRGIASLRPHNLVYDLLISAPQLPAATALVDRHPHQPFVLNHLAKPRIDLDNLDPWRTHLHDLARRDNVYCKLSGGITEISPSSWTPQRLRPYLDTALEAFGPDRLMFGSNWPVSEAAGGYARWLTTISDWATTSLSPDERAMLFSRTATNVYRLELPP